MNLIKRIRNLWRLSELNYNKDFVIKNKSVGFTGQDFFEEVKQAIIIKKKDDVIDRIVNGK